MLSNIFFHFSRKTLSFSLGQGKEAGPLVFLTSMPCWGFFSIIMLGPWSLLHCRSYLESSLQLYQGSLMQLNMHWRNVLATSQKQSSSSLHMSNSDIGVSLFS